MTDADHDTSAQPSPPPTDAPDSPAASAPQERSLLRVVVISVVIALSAAAYVGVRRIDLPFIKGPSGYVLIDPDSNVRWRLVTRAVEGDEGVRIRRIEADNAPAGRVNEWTSPMTILGVAATRVTQLVGRMGQKKALEIAPLWLGPFIGLMTGVALLVIGWRLGGWAVGLGAFVAWPALQHIFVTTQIGNVDYHSFHYLLTVLLYGGCLLARRRWSLGAAIALGLVSALGIWSSSTEFLVILLPVCILAIVDVVRPSSGDAGQTQAFWRGWWITSMVGISPAPGRM